MKYVSGTREYFQKLALAEEYCNGDIEKAKKILSGELKDTLAIKGRFEDREETTFGLFCTYLSTVSYRVLGNQMKITDYTSVNNNKPINSIDTFQEKLNKAKLHPDINPSDMIQMNIKMKTMFTMTTAVSIIELIGSHDIKGAEKKFASLITGLLKKECEVDIDVEETTSILLNDSGLID